MTKRLILLILTGALLTSCRLARSLPPALRSTPLPAASALAESTPAPTLKLTATPLPTPTFPPDTPTPSIDTTPIYDVAYSTESTLNPRSLSLDIYPSGQPNSPVMIFVHGGGWTLGNKSNVDSKPAGFNSLGFVFISINYRMIPEVDVTQEVRDVARSIAWVHENITPYGGDPTRIFLMGHSAGAHLVSLVATDETYLAENGLSLTNIRGVISLDTQAYDLPTLMSNLPPETGRVYPTAFGDDPALWEAMSPQLHLAPDKNIPPFAVAYTGKQEERISLTTNFVTALQQNGIPALLVPAPNKTHGEINQEFGMPGDDITQTVFDWLIQILTGLKSP